MGCITYQMMQELRNVGFSFPAYENFINLGMVFYYKDDEYYVGGFCNSEYSETDLTAGQKGCWLPTESELLEWLHLTDFDVNIQLTGSIMCLHVTGRDRTNQMEYGACGGSLAYALHKLIYKICKSNKRPYVPRYVERIELSNRQD